MIFSIKFINLKLNTENFEAIHAKVIEICSDCLVHDCNTPDGFTIQLKPIDHEIAGRVELEARYDGHNVLVIGIEKEFQTPWSLEKMEQLVQDLQTYDQSLK